MNGVPGPPSEILVRWFCYLSIVLSISEAPYKILLVDQISELLGWKVSGNSFKILVIEDPEWGTYSSFKGAFHLESNMSLLLGEKVNKSFSKENSPKQANFEIRREIIDLAQLESLQEQLRQTELIVD